MEGQRGMTIFFLCVPLEIFAGLVIGTVSSIAVRRQGLAGFLAAQGLSLLILCGLAGLLSEHKRMALRYRVHPVTY
jgi:hypothetical protein